MKALIGQLVTQVAELLTIHAVPIAMMANGSGGNARGTNGAATSTGESVDLWLRSWVAPALLLAVGMVVFQAGVYVGRGEVEILTERLANHEQIGIHPEAMRRVEVDAEFRAVRIELRQQQVQLDRIEGLLMNGPLTR